MSKGNRLRNYAVGLIAGLIIAFGVGSQFWMPANQLDTAIQRQASENASEQSQRGEIAVREECAAVLTPAEQRDCIAKETQPYREAERNERDLEAQQVMANWTRVMGKAAIIGMGVGIIGLFLIFTTFWETRKAAQAGFTANEIARTGMERQLRPWVRIKVIKPLWLQSAHEGEFEFVSDIELENFGHGPALDLSYFSTFLFHDPEPEELSEYADKWFDSDGSVWRDKNLFQRDVWNRRTSAVHAGEPPGKTILNYIIAARYRTGLDDSFHYTINIYSLHGEGRGEVGMIDLTNNSNANSVAHHFSEHQRCPGVLT